MGSVPCVHAKLHYARQVVHQLANLKVTWCSFTALGSGYQAHNHKISLHFRKITSESQENDLIACGHALSTPT